MLAEIELAVNPAGVLRFLKSPEILENDSVVVKAGCVGEAQKMNRVAVPTHCWKVIYVKGQAEAYVFPNVPERSKSFEMHKVPLDSVKKLTKLPIK